MIKGQIIRGDYNNIVAREKAGTSLELGELLVADTSEGSILLQVFDLHFGSQISPQNLELISGMSLEEGTKADFMDPHLRNYKLAFMKALISVKGSKASVCKTLPSFFSNVRELTKQDLSFVTKPDNPLFVGNIRSGSKMLDCPVFLDGKKALAHHILIPAATGRGKSNLASCMLWDLVDKDYCSVLVLDPHDEYYGRNKLGLKDHPESSKVVYYTPKNPPPGCKTLKINIRNIRPNHFSGVVQWSDAQHQALSAYYKRFREDWISAIIREQELQNVEFKKDTLAVVKRRIMSLLDINMRDDDIVCSGIFDLQAGQTTIKDIFHELEFGKIVIIDTSSFSGSAEVLVGSLIASEVFHNYRRHKFDGTLRDKPVISIVLEEAPRVLGKEILERGPNVFSQIAREGRKFKVGLIAITQLPSLIPRDIFANMNTKIILGVEMKPERQALIDSAAQDLSSDDRNIASLDVGEAIITSNFLRFATPVRIPFFDEIVKSQKSSEPKKDFSGIH